MKKRSFGPCHEWNILIHLIFEHIIRTDVFNLLFFDLKYVKISRSFRKSIMLRIIKYFLSIALCMVVFFICIWSHQNSKIHTSPLPCDVAIVFGAGIRGNRPCAVLYDRIEKAVELYKKGIIKKIVLTGDNRFYDYNEPKVMGETAIKLGVPEHVLIFDYAGRRTYDSCYRALHIFGIQKAILITQRFHLNRSLYIASSLGMDVVGVPCDRIKYPSSSKMWWVIREMGAFCKAWYDLWIVSPRVMGGEKNI
jgi:SanA protein